MMERPRFYYDLFSVYAYLGSERIDSLIPDAEWRPIYLFGLFKLNGRSSWVFSDQREARMREIEKRAAAYELPPIRWPDSFPADLVRLNRAATAANREGREREFSRLAFRAIYVDGVDASTTEHLHRLGAESGLDPDAFMAAIDGEEVKAQLRATTEEAHHLRVPGVPTVVIGGHVVWGDDRLEQAATLAREVPRGASASNPT